MKSGKNAGKSISVILWAVTIALLGATVSVQGATPDDLVKQIEKALSGVQRRIVTAPSRAEKEFIEARKLLAQLKKDSPSHAKLATLQKRADGLATKLEKRLGRPIGGAAKKEETKPKAPPQKATPSTLPRAVVSSLKQMDTALSTVAKALEKKQLQTAARNLKTAQKKMDEIQKRYGKKIPAGNEEMKAAAARLAAALEKVTQAQSAIDAAAAALAAKEQQKEAQSNEWFEKFSPFFDSKTGKYLLMGAQFNSASDAEKAKCRQAYAEANELMAAYKKVKFPHGQTPALISLAQRVSDHLTMYNEDEARARKEESCRPWVDKLRAYVDVGAGSKKYLVDSVTLSETDIQQRTALLEEAKALWPEYEKAKFPHGKTDRLLALEKEMQQRFRDMPESLRKSRALISGDIEKEFDRVLGYLTKDTGWKADTAKKPNIVMARDVTSLQKAMDRYAGTVKSDDAQLATLKKKLAQIQQQDQKNRALRADRTFMTPDQFKGDGAAELRQKVEQIVTEKGSKKPLRVTLPAENWKEERVLEFTDTTQTVLRHRITRFMTAQAAAKGADGKVYLHGVHLANDRQSDGTWGPLHGHIMWSDWMAEKNITKKPPAK